MKKLIAWLRPESTRAYLYRVLLVLLPVLVGLAHWSSGTSSTILTIAAAVLGFGSPALAAAHTSTKAVHLATRRKRKGLLPADPDRPRLHLAVAPSASLTDVGLYAKVRSWGMLLNDRIGDCGPAAVGHAIKLMAAATGRRVSITEKAVLAFYILNTGYDPKTGANDTGVVLQKMLELWRKVGLAGHKILAFGDLALDALTIHAAVANFGFVVAGIKCPKSAEDEFNAGLDWIVVPRSPIEGGHCVLIVGYDKARGCWVIVTWGGIAYVTPAFFAKYLTEAWAVISPDWLEANGNTPLGETVAQLGAEFTELTGEPSPFPAAA